jgi:hypothetical protein
LDRVVHLAGTVERALTLPQPPEEKQSLSFRVEGRFLRMTRRLHPLPADAGRQRQHGDDSNQNDEQNLHGRLRVSSD